MLFNSINFALFLPIVFAMYWCLRKKTKHQNVLLMIASYYFYACWDYRFLFLLVFSTFLDYFTGIKMYESKSQRIKKIWFWVSIGINLGVLIVFKYFNFFTENISDIVSFFGYHTNTWLLKVILPVGISFYTFHGLSYVIDIYKGRIKPERDFINYSLFVSFFPLLVAGPIERATHLLPQIQKKREFVYSEVISGLRQILWGLFKKIVIADSCAVFADNVFNNSSDYSGSAHVLGAFFFTVQIYGDFSGYSDIALGVAKLFGINLLRNFSYPYFSRDIAEFWRRWHISLSSWFRDYLYIPLGGSRGGLFKKVRNVFIIFIVSGFWHGAQWTFLVWGLLNALYILPSILFDKNRVNLNIVAEGKALPTLKEFISISITFGLTLFAWIFFRSKDLKHAFVYIKKIFSSSLLRTPALLGDEGKMILILVIFFFIIEWIGREDDFAIERLGLRWPKAIRYAFYYSLILCICYFAGAEQQFIYFQF